jgi:Uma2 family endonuclease
MMRRDVLTPPRTIMELYNMLPEGTLAEIIDGALYMSPAPQSNHQLVSAALTGEIRNYLKKTKKGVVLAAPCDVFLDGEKNVVQPDLVIILANNQSIIKNHIYGVPDMVIEILSPGSLDYDTVKKKELYQRFGVKEYWIVDPQSKEATGFELKAGAYHEIGHAQGKIDSPLLQQAFDFQE